MNNGISCFLRYLPDLTQTPPEDIESPDDFDKVTMRIESEAQRIGSEEKLTSLYSLRGDVIKSRSVKFHWGLSDIIEMKAINLSRVPDDTEIEVASLEARGLSSQSSRLRYDINAFVAIRGKQDGTSTEVWVGRNVHCTAR